jgi:hypothetical protein
MRGISETKKKNRNGHDDHVQTRGNSENQKKGTKTDVMIRSE